MATKISMEELKKYPIIKTLVSPIYQKEKVDICPHREWNDLVIIYRIQIEEMKAVFITYDLMNVLGWTEEDLYEMSIVPKICYKGLMQIMAEILGQAFDFEMEENTYVLTNEDKWYGASCVLDRNFLRRTLGNTKAFIVPSSIHEMLVHPLSGISRTEMNSIINDVNRTTVEECDRLGNHVYYWNGREIVIPKRVK